MSSPKSRPSLSNTNLETQQRYIFAVSRLLRTRPPTASSVVCFSRKLVLREPRRTTHLLRVLHPYKRRCYTYSGDMDPEREEPFADTDVNVDKFERFLEEIARLPNLNEHTEQEIANLRRPTPQPLVQAVALLENEKDVNEDIVPLPEPEPQARHWVVQMLGFFAAIPLRIWDMVLDGGRQ